MHSKRSIAAAFQVKSMLIFVTVAPKPDRIRTSFFIRSENCDRGGEREQRIYVAIFSLLSAVVLREASGSRSRRTEQYKNWCAFGAVATVCSALLTPCYATLCHGNTQYLLLFGNNLITANYFKNNGFQNDLYSLLFMRHRQYQAPIQAKMGHNFLNTIWTIRQFRQNEIRKPLRTHTHTPGIRRN